MVCRRTIIFVGAAWRAVSASSDRSQAWWSDHFLVGFFRKALDCICVGKCLFGLPVNCCVSEYESEAAGRRVVASERLREFFDPSRNGRCEN